MKKKIWSHKEKQILLIIAIGILISTIALHHQKTHEKTEIINIAKEHLQKYVHNAFPNVNFFSIVRKVEIVDGECEANHYWERWDQPPIQSSKHQCWIVKFYYPGAAEDSYLAVYVDKKTKEVIGGTQTR